MQMIRMPLGIYQANCYIIWDEDTNIAAVIDPGGDFESLKYAIDKKGLNVKYIILTHAHADHIGALDELKEYSDAKILVHHDDYEMLKDKRKNHSNMMGNKIIELEADERIKDGDKILIGNTELYIIHTPGHSEGSICIRSENLLFTGDTLFAGSIGRTDLEGGSFVEIIKSIKNKIIILPDETKIYPGHGPSTTVAIEKENNPFLI